MDPKTGDDQNVKLLLSILDCVLENGGKIDWTVIAQKNGIPTAGAASMRLRRLREAVKSGSDENNATSTPNSPKSPAKKVTTPKATTPKTTKKRPAKKAAEDESPKK